MKCQSCPHVLNISSLVRLKTASPSTVALRLKPVVLVKEKEYLHLLASIQKEAQQYTPLPTRTAYASASSLLLHVVETVNGAICNGKS